MVGILFLVKQLKESLTVMGEVMQGKKGRS